MDSYTQMKWFKAKGMTASQLRQRKYELVRRCGFPENAIGGSLALTHRRCGKPTCHCASGKGHPMWSLTFMVDGKKWVERIPEAWVEQIQSLVRQGREYKDALAEFLAINAQLLALWRKENSRRHSK